jgi:putative ABC transport system permease protein
MFKNYVKIFIRNLRKQKVYSFINIFGLSVGLTVFILAVTVFDFNVSFDSFNENPERINLVTSEHVSSNGATQKAAYSYLPLANLFAEKFPELENATTIRQYFRNIFRYQDKKFYEKGVLFADTNFLRVFSYPVIAGDKDLPLSRPHSVVLTESASRKYFGTENPIGRILTTDLDDAGLVVTAVISDCPPNSSIRFDVLLSLPLNYSSDWGISGSTYTFVKLKNGASAAALEAKLPRLIDEQIPVLRDERTMLSLRPLQDIHLKSMDLSSGFSITPIIQYYWILGIALGLLVVVSINFMILSTSRYSNRAKEVGIRKAIGAGRRQLIVQYIGESLITALIALPLALVMFEIIRPAFTAIVGGGIELSLTRNPALLLIVFAVTFSVGFVSGIYPAFFLSSFQAASVFRSQKVMGKRGFNFRKALVVFQFALTFIMITATILLMRQLGMLSQVSLGYDRENIVAIPCNFEVKDKFDVLEKQLKQNPDIAMVADGRILPFGGGYRQAKMRVEGMDDKSSEGIDYYPCGRNFIEILNIKIAQGRSFSTQFNDSNSVIVSEGAAKHFNLDDPLGKKIILDNGGRQLTIIGVAKDFHFPHVFLKKAPAVLYFLPSGPFYVFIKTVGKPDDGTIDFVRAKWNKIVPNLPFDYFTLEDQFQDQLRTSTKSVEVFEFISVVAVLIASLGLFALASFTAERKTKEIGVRKVLGASFADVAYLLVSEFLLIVVVADLIALPFAYYLSEYLVNVAWVYRIDVNIWLFLIAVVVSLLAALSAVGVQCVKSASANPVEALRYE